MKTCSHCGVILERNKSEIKCRVKNIKRKYCSLTCANRSRGCDPIKTRYRSIKINGKRKLEHRHVMELHIKRELKRKELVHHINGIKIDNRIENLEIMDPVTHGRLHHLKYNLDKNCEICGDVFTPHKTKRKRNRTCSIRCRYLLMSRTKKSPKRQQKLG